MSATSCSASPPARKPASGAVLIYLSIYLFMTAGAFAVILSIASPGADGRAVDGPRRLGSVAALAGARPWRSSCSRLAASAARRLIGKVYVFYAAIDAGNHAPTAIMANWLYVGAGLGATISVVSMFYYLGHSRSSIRSAGSAPGSPGRHGASAALAVTGLFTLLFHLRPRRRPCCRLGHRRRHSLVR